MIKKFLLPLLAALVVTTLMACSGSEQQSQPNAGGTTAQEKTQKEQANLELTQMAYDTAKAELMSGNYDAALAAFKEVESIISLSGVEGFDDIEAYKYTCNYYRLSDYLRGFSSSAEYAVSDTFSLFARDVGNDGVLIAYEGISATVGDSLKIGAHFEKFTINIPTPDKEVPTIPEEIEWEYASSDALNGFSPIANATGKINPKDWLTFRRKDSEHVVIGTILEIVTQSGSEDKIKMNPKSYCRNLMDSLNDFLAATGLGMTVADLGIQDIDVELNNFVKNN